MGRRMASSWDQLKLNVSVLSLPLAPPRSTPKNLPFAQPRPKLPSLTWPCLCLRRVTAASTQAEDHCLGTLPGSGVPRKLDAKSSLAFHPGVPQRTDSIMEGRKEVFGAVSREGPSPHPLSAFSSPVQPPTDTVQASPQNPPEAILATMTILGARS